MGLAVCNKKLIKAFIDSGYKDRDLVINFFTWDLTPQGVDYWWEIHKGKDISREGIEYLRGLVGYPHTYPEDGSWV